MNDGGGTVTIEQNEVDGDAQSTLCLTQQNPPRYEHRQILSFTMTIDQPGKDGSEPLVLTTKKPMILGGQLTQFPPRGDLYTLEQPVELVDPDNPDNVLAVIQKFPVKAGGL
ncbi:hypothetical protein ACGFZB_24160 [Streptomyces cinerochromogenes]|uniref:Uncharacterized protein n=1 Tax=Streptomyces cinerochromogenes TaxID=66422 RepID=A0ABW7B9H2_9ACTN